MKLTIPLTRCVKKIDSWKMVKNNIALKDGDYPGSKNVSRFRVAITNHIDHLQKDNEHVDNHFQSQNNNESDDFV